MSNTKSVLWIKRYISYNIEGNVWGERRWPVTLCRQKRQGDHLLTHSPPPRLTP